ncbi:MAG TPA: class I SAM-dependent methyltransferase [Rhodanobacteraceae bacterium]|jgi:SAM-dependent methyltransferase|nr:class I SAM-dependent methyltransferase [Rhodanobacteraceae bacterium]
MHTSHPSLDQVPATEEAAVWAYRLILGREPESAAIASDHARQSRSLKDLRERFLESSEFTQRYRVVERERGRNVSVFPPCAIQTKVDAGIAADLFDRVARSWTRFGNSEPYWSVLSEPQYMMERIGETREAFLESGRENMERLFATLRRNGISIDPSWDVLELGCGLGRTTRWLTEHFRRIFAVDVSGSHLELAQQLNADAPHADRIVWTKLGSRDDLSGLPAFDLFFSMIVLQHNPPPVIGMLLETVAEKLRPGGFAFFQVPTYQRGYSFDVNSYLALSAHEPDIEMHAFPQEEVFRIFRERGCIPLEVFEDGLSGHRDNHRSNSFLFRKLATDEDPVQMLARSQAYARSLEAEIARMDANARSEHAVAQEALADAARYAATLEAEREDLKRKLAHAQHSRGSTPGSRTP